MRLEKVLDIIRNSVDIKKKSEKDKEGTDYEKDDGSNLRRAGTGL